MAVKLEQAYHEGVACNLLLTIGYDDETESYEFNEGQVDNLATAVFYWQYETEKRKRKMESVVVNDDGTTTVTRRKGE